MPEQPRTPLALAALATLARPGLDVVGTRPPRDPGSDFDVAGIVDGDQHRWIVRAPRHAAAGAAMEGEVALLEGLSLAVDDGLLPFDVPRPQGFAPLPEGGRAMLYPEVVGAPVSVAEMAGRPRLLTAVSHAVAALHELPPALVSAAGLPAYDADGYRRRRLAELDDAARTGHLPEGLHRRWEHALEDVSLWRFAATVVHGDLAAEHVLVGGDVVVGIVDWSDARVADPADDLAWLIAELPTQQGEQLLEQYAASRRAQLDDAIEARATLAAELAIARWLMHGVRIRSNDVIEDAVQMLRELDELLLDAPPIGRIEPVVEPFYEDEDLPEDDEDLPEDDEDLPEDDEDLPEDDEDLPEDDDLSDHAIEPVTESDEGSSEELDEQAHRAPVVIPPTTRSPDGALTSEDTVASDHDHAEPEQAQPEQPSDDTDAIPIDGGPVRLTEDGRIAKAPRRLPPPDDQTPTTEIPLSER